MYLLERILYSLQFLYYMCGVGNQKAQESILVRSAATFSWKVVDFFKNEYNGLQMFLCFLDISIFSEG